MITLSYEALFTLIALCGGAGYMLGRDIHKAKKQSSHWHWNDDYFLINSNFGATVLLYGSILFKLIVKQ